MRFINTVQSEDQWGVSLIHHLWCFVKYEPYVCWYVLYSPDGLLAHWSVGMVPLTVGCLWKRTSRVRSDWPGDTGGGARSSSVGERKQQARTDWLTDWQADELMGGNEPQHVSVNCVFHSAGLKVSRGGAAESPAGSALLFFNEQTT